jgi:hypothetical protein
LKRQPPSATFGAVRNLDVKSAMEKNWYYSIELEKGVFTKGHDHPNLSVTRKLLRTVDFKGQDCLDIGTQEAIIPILLKKGGANRVVAYDRNDLTDKIELLQETYGTPFDYLAGLQLTDLPAKLDASGGRFFDLVVFSGVLYHMINPLGLLALVRGFSKVGGLFLIETAVMQHAEPKLVFNVKGKQYGFSSNYFVPTTTWLDYVLRMLCLRPLSVEYTGSNSDSAISRVAILCRSEDTPQPLEKDDEWMMAPFHQKTFSNESQVDWDGMRQTRSNIELHSAAAPLKGGLYEAIRNSAGHKAALPELRLSLDAVM